MASFLLHFAHAQNLYASHYKPTTLHIIDLLSCFLLDKHFWLCKCAQVCIDDSSVCKYEVTVWSHCNVNQLYCCKPSTVANLVCVGACLESREKARKRNGVHKVQTAGKFS